MKMQRTPLANHGFTLAELAIVLAIVGFLMGGLLPVLSAQLEGKQNADTQKTLSEVREALIGYAASHFATATNKPYLPCPDTDNDGLENRVVATGLCVAQQGNLPWATLGVGNADAWGNRFLYSVSNSFSRADNGFSLVPPSTGVLRVCQEPACTTITGSALPAVVLSFGRNSYGATTSTGSAIPAPLCPNSGQSCLDEAENRDADNDFVTHLYAPRDADRVEFDDIVTWLSPNILFNRMISAGRLP